MQFTRKSFLKGVAGLAAASGTDWGLPEPILAAQEAAKPRGKQSRITSVDIFAWSIPLTVVFRIALGAIETADNVLVRLRTDDGVVGWGEGSPFTPITGETQAMNIALGKNLAELIRGRDPFTIARIVAAMDAFAPHSPSIKAACEMALWDICGKIAGQPLYRLLGNYRDSFETDQTVSLDEPAAMAKWAKEFVGKGFKVIKVKVGQAPALDIERVKTIREAIGYNVRIRIDANQGWKPSDAIYTLRQLEKYQIEFCEQPVAYWDWPGMKYVRQNVGIPIMADESVHTPHDAIAGIRHDAMDMINIKLMKAGGILQGMRIAHIADAANLTCMVGCMSESRLALTAAAHLVASQKNILYADLDSNWDHSIDPIIGGMQVQGGVVRLPDAPGLGVDLDPTFVSKLQPVK